MLWLFAYDFRRITQSFKIKSLTKIGERNFYTFMGDYVDRFFIKTIDKSPIRVYNSFC